MGGSLAAYIAATRPERVTDLALLAPSGYTGALRYRGPYGRVVEPRSAEGRGDAHRAPDRARAARGWSPRCSVGSHTARAPPTSQRPSRVSCCATKRDLPLAIPMCELGHILYIDSLGRHRKRREAPLASSSKVS